MPVSHIFAFSQRFFIHCADPAGLSRVDLHSLPQQTLMELLVADMSDTARFQQLNGEFRSFHRWSGVSTWPSQSSDSSELEVVKIFWAHHHARPAPIGSRSCPRGVGGGVIDLRYIPPTVVSLCIQFKSVAGELDCGALPKCLEHFSVKSNRLSGTVDLRRLPEHIRRVDLTANEFSGEIDLTSLPKSLENLSAGANTFSGIVNLSHLPARLQTLVLCGNKLSGTIDCASLPDAMQVLTLGNNAFTGSIDFTSLPVRLHSINVSQNNLSGSVDLTHLPGRIQYVYASENLFSGSIDITKLPTLMRAIDLRANQLSQEEVCVSKLPDSITEIDLKENAMERLVDESGMIITSRVVLLSREDTPI